ncbi:MAG: VanZ family protein [Candidatus Zixiibacteriota bacterium]
MEYKRRPSYPSPTNRMARVSTRVFRLLAVVYAIVVIVVSSWPRLRLPAIPIGNLDKVAHFGQYLILAYLVGRGWAYDVPSHRRLVSLTAVAIVVVFAGLDEYHQAWVPGREADVFDWLADLSGIMVGFTIGSGLLWRRLGSGVSRRGLDREKIRS